MTLRALALAGARAVSKYTGTVIAVFVVQVLVALACMLGLWLVLAQVFAHYPRFDDAVDGDIVALIECVRFAVPALLANAAIVVSTLAAWQLATWFLVGGLAGVLAQRPDGRGETARCFGANGASTFLAYARLALVSLPGWTLVGFVAATTLHAAMPRVETALSLPQLLGPIALALLPPALLLHFFGTVTDYTRIELTLRRDSHDLGVLSTYLRTGGFVLRRPATLVHAGLGWALFWIVTAAYVALSAGHPMFGAGGALALFAVRLGVALVRLVIKVGVLAGQVELGRVRPLPPQRPTAKLAPKP